MKKVLLFAALAIAALVSCNKEIYVEEVVKPDAVPEGYVPVTLNALYDQDTKASLVDNMIIWDMEEELAVFADGAGDPIKFVVSNSYTLGSSVGVTISGSVPEGTKSFVAVYPWQEGLSCVDGVVSLNIPEEQHIPAECVVDPKAMPSVAYFAGADSYGTFRNVMSLIKFNVGKTEGVEEVRVVFGEGAYSAGAVTAKIDTENDGAPEIGNNCDAYATVTAEGGFLPETDYWISVAPVKATGIMAVARVDNKAYAKESDKEIELARNKGINLGDITVEASDRYVGIKTAEDLTGFLAEADKYPAGWEVKVLNDLDCSGAEIGSAEDYSGVFDAQGYSIKNWTSNGTPLFISNHGTIKDLVIDGSCTLTWPAELKDGFGFVANNAYGVVSGVVNNANVTGTTVFKGGRAAAIIGWCNAKGLGHEIIVENCVNNGDLTFNTEANTGGTQYVGTVVGSMGESTKNAMIDCVNNGKLSVICSGTNTKNFYIGGVVGGTTNGSNNIRLINKGDVTLTCAGHNAALCLAGITSYTTGLLTDCENTGNITFHSDGFLKGTFVAGIAGYYASNNMSGCVNRGNITVEAAAIGGRNNIGDLTGESGKENSWFVSNKKNYAMAAGFTTGGLVSATGKNVSFENSDNYGNISVTFNDPLKSGYGTSTVARPSVGGLVGDCSAPMLNCNNSGNVNVVVGDGTDFTCTNAGYTFHVGGVVGCSWNFSGSKTSGGTDYNYYNKFSLENCNNSGNVSYTSYNKHTTNNTVGGICGWPQSEDKTAKYVAKNCVNTGNVSGIGNAKIRVGGIHGGTGRMEGCTNTGNVYIEAAQPESVAGSIAGFHSQAHTFSNCIAGGTVTANCTVAGLGGLVGQLGNVTFNGMDGCSVDCELNGGPEGKTGLIVGAYNGAVDKKIVLGTEEDPIEIAGKIDGTDVTAENVATYFCGKGNISVDNHTVYYSLGGQAYEFPALVAERAWGFYKDSSPWYDTSKITAVSISHPDGYGMARSLAMDDDYIYLPKSSAYANIAAVSIKDQTSQKALNKSTIAGGSIFATSFVRMIKNTDASVNEGKDILLVCNLTATDSDANQLRLYAYKDGVDAAPTQIAGFCWDSANNVNDWRRYGDRFFVTGTWQDGKVYFPSFNPNKIVVLSIANGARTAVTQIAAGENSPSGIKDITVEGENLFITNGAVANMVAATGNLANGWNEYALTASSANATNTWGYNVFTLKGRKYVAYARITDETKAHVEIIKYKDDLLTSLDAKAGLVKRPINDAEDLDKEVATGGVADCCVRVIDGKAYVAALTRDGGCVLDVLTLE